MPGIVGTSSLQVFPEAQTGLPNPHMKWHLVDRKRETHETIDDIAGCVAQYLKSL
jgi:hypothetical protein